MNNLSITVPFYGLDREFKRYKQYYNSIIQQVLATGCVLQGPEVQRFEENLAKRCGRAFAVTTGSCTDALAFALLAHGIKPGDHVIVTAFSFIASASPILRIGAVPKFVDIKPNYFMSEPEQISAAIDEGTKAIIAVPLFGQTMPMAEVESVAREHGVVLIEDAAQGFGSCDGNRNSGSMGQTSCVSFDPTKVLASFGSGGALLTDSPEIADKANRLRYHGRNNKTRLIEDLGYNSRISTTQAAVLDYKLTLMDEWQRRRDEIAGAYLTGLAEVEDISLPLVRPNSTHTWHKFVIQAENRDHLADTLRKYGVSTMVHYPRTLPDEPVMKKYSETCSDVSIARSITKRVLSLPIHPELTDREVDHVICSVKSACTRDVKYD